MMSFIDLRAGAGVAGGVPPDLPVHIVQCVENWWVRGDTLLAVPTRSLKSMNDPLIYTKLATLCLLGCDTVGWYLVTRLYGVTCQKSVVFIVSAISGVECLLRKCIGKCWVSLAAQKCKFYV